MVVADGPQGSSVEELDLRTEKLGTMFLSASWHLLQCPPPAPCQHSHGGERTAPDPVPAQPVLHLSVNLNSQSLFYLGAFGARATPGPVRRATSCTFMWSAKAVGSQPPGCRLWREGALWHPRARRLREPLGFVFQICLHSCFQTKMVEKCGCAQYNQPLPPAANYCNYQQHPNWSE